MKAFPAGKLPLNTPVIVNRRIRGTICGYGRWLGDVRSPKGGWRQAMISGYLVQLENGEDFENQQLYVSTIPVHPENLERDNREN